MDTSYGVALFFSISDFNIARAGIILDLAFDRLDGRATVDITHQQPFENRN